MYTHSSMLYKYNENFHRILFIHIAPERYITLLINIDIGINGQKKKKRKKEILH